MLQQMRSGAASWIAKGLMVLLILSFGVWGIADYVGSFGRSGDVAKVGSAAITQTEFVEAFRREVNNLRRRFGSNFSNEQARQLGMDESVLNRLIEDKLYVQTARNMGVSVSDQQVRDTIMNAAAFKGMAGQFDRLAFESYLRNEGYSESMLVALLREDIARTQLVGSLFGSITTAPKAMADAVLAYRLERRLAEYMIVDASKLPAPAAPSDAQIDEYYKANPAAYTTPERRSVAWFEIGAEQRAAVMTVTEDELRAEYDANSAAYTVPERRAVEQVVFSTEAEAKAASEAIAKGESFLAMAERTQKLKADDVKLGVVSRAELPASIANAAFALAPNKVSEPTISPFGFHLLRVTEIQPGSTRSFDEAKAELRQQVGLRKALNGMVKLRQQIDDQIAGGATLEEVAKAQEIALQQATDIDSQGLGADGKPANLPKQPTFFAETFQLSPDSEPHIVDTDTGLIVMKVTGIKPAAQRPLAEVKADVVAALQQRARGEAATAKANEIAERLRAGGDLGKEAAAINTAVQLSAPLTRGQPAERNFSPVINGSLFNAKPGEIVTGPAAMPGPSGAANAIVARLTRVEPADPAAIARGQDQTGQQLAAGIAQDLLQQYRGVLQKDIGVSINAAARQRAISGGGE